MRPIRIRCVGVSSIGLEERFSVANASVGDAAKHVPPRLTEHCLFGSLTGLEKPALGIVAEGLLVIHPSRPSCHVSTITDIFRQTLKTLGLSLSSVSSLSKRHPHCQSTVILATLLVPAFLLQLDSARIHIYQAH